MDDSFARHRKAARSHIQRKGISLGAHYATEPVESLPVEYAIELVSAARLLMSDRFEATKSIHHCGSVVGGFPFGGSIAWVGTFNNVDRDFDVGESFAISRANLLFKALQGTELNESIGVRSLEGTHFECVLCIEELTALRSYLLAGLQQCGKMTLVFNPIASFF